MKRLNHWAVRQQITFWPLLSQHFASTVSLQALWKYTCFHHTNTQLGLLRTPSIKQTCPWPPTWILACDKLLPGQQKVKQIVFQVPPHTSSYTTTNWTGTKMIKVQHHHVILFSEWKLNYLKTNNYDDKKMNLEHYIMCMSVCLSVCVFLQALYNRALYLLWTHQMDEPWTQKQQHQQSSNYNRCTQNQMGHQQDQ